ncbi:CHAT domain-containing protein [Nocardia sp. NPDC051463]|uniref:CHAT domain-containing protein n=1 Tax=Nocardia sp. NPDC051463 TaxID=3154845 RepID=UPI003422F9BF
MADGAHLTERSRKTVEDLIGFFGADREEFARLLGALETPTELRFVAHEAATDAIERNEFDRAQAALFIEQAACQELGDLAGTVDTGIRIADVMKVIAVDVPDYEAARSYAQVMAGLSRRMKRASSQFAALAVAADSAYFAAEALEEQRELGKHREWLLTTLADAVQAIGLLPAASPGRGSSFLSMVLATAQRIMGLHWFDSEDGSDRTTVTESLRRIALALESFLGTKTPPGATSAELLVDARILARLSYRYGSPDKAFDRLSGVVDRAATEGDVVTFIAASATRYEGERASSRLSEHLRNLRREYQTGLEDVRRSKRSRAGRLQIAEVLDRSIGSMVADEFADELEPDAAAAFESMEIGKARCLLDEINGVVRQIGDPVVARKALATEIQLLHLPAPNRATPAADEFQLLSRLPFGGLTGIGDHIEQLDLLERTYAAADGGFVGSAAITDLADVSASLAGDETIVSYHIPFEELDPGGTLLVMWITRERTLTLHLPLIYDGKLEFIGRIQADGQQPLDVGPLMNLIAMTRYAIREGQDALIEEDLSQLYRMLIAPLETYGFSASKFSRITIVPSGVLHSVPFSALRNSDGRFLIELAPVVVAPSISVWQHLAQRQSQMPAPSTFVGFGNPEMPPEWESLPEAEREIARIVDHLQGFETYVHTGAAASESAFYRDTPGKHFVHIASHGDFPENDALDMHRIVLAADDCHDGFLHAEEVRRADLSAAQLVVLSVCDGALIRFGPGDEPLGLLSAFFAAGAINIVAPLWDIDDYAAADWMAEFYRGVPGSGPARALQSACVVRARNGAQIRDWAGFTLFGVGRPYSAATDQTAFSTIG